MSEPTTLPGLFERQADLTPDHPALDCAGTVLTYAQLDTAAARLARTLTERGIGPESLVALALPRTEELVVAMLAVLKAGAAYLPLDLGHPAERIAFTLADAAPSVTLTTAPLPVDAEVLDVSGCATEGAPVDRCPPPGPSNLAYVIYTSGSTGQPKGVLIEHAAVVNQLRWLAAEHGMGTGERMLARTSVSFDASVWELWLPLTTGGTVCLAPAEVTRDPAALLAFAEQSGVTTAQFVPSLLPGLLDAGRCPSLRRVFCGGEPLPGALAARVVAEWGTSVTNLYGPTETTIQVTSAGYVGGAPDVVPIGKPVWNTQAHVLDDDLRPVPDGVVGELYIGGAQLARGYLNRPELTAERFVDDPAGNRLYRTGDRVRRLPDGNLEYVGRIDHQIKFLGYRIEPGEIEARLRGHEAVTEAVVLLEGGSTGKLVAYLHCAGEEPPAPADLRAHLGATLPSYMIPAAYRALPSIPLTSNGKIDRAALPELGVPLADSSGGEPLTATGHVIAGIYASVLDVPLPSPGDSFFDLGGHSLLVARLVGRIVAATGLPLALRDVLNHPRVQDLADHLDAGSARLGGTLSPDAAVIGPDEGVPATSMQEQMRLAELLDPAGSAYNVPLTWRVTGELDPGALRSAFGALIERHEILRTAFADAEGTLRQVVRQPWVPDIEQADLRGMTTEAQASTVDENVDAEAALPFDLAAGRPLRVRLLRTADAEHMLLICLHHLVCDGQSIPVLVRDLGHAYARATGANVPDQPAPAQFRTVAEHQRERLAGEDGRDGLDYWATYLDGAPAALELGNAPARPGPHGAVPVPFSPRFAEHVAPLQAEYGASWYMVAAAAVAAMLHRFTGTDDVTVGLPVANREDEEHADVVGPCLNMVVLRSRRAAGDTVGDLLSGIRESILDAFEYQSVPLPAVLDRLDPPRRRGRIPYLDVALAVMTTSAAAQEFGPADIVEVPFDRWTHDRKFGINITFTDRDGEIGAVLSFRGDRYTSAQAITMATWLGRLLDDVGALTTEPLEQVLPTEDQQYRDFAAANAFDGDTARASLDHWERALTGAPAYPAVRPPLRPEPAGSVPIDLAPGTLARLRAMQTEYGVSWFMLAATAVAALLHRWTGEDDITFGVPVANREDFADVVGPCLNTVVLRSRCDEDTTVRELLDRMCDTVLDAFDHQRVPFESVVDRLNPPRRPGWTPYLEVLLAVTAGDTAAPTVIGGATLEPLTLDHDGAGYAGKFALTVGIEEVAGELRGTAMYRGDRVTGAEVRWMAHWIGRFLESFADLPDRQLRAVDLVDAAELAQLRQFEEGPPAAKVGSVPELFAARLAADPDAPAIRTGTGVLSYRELDRRAAGLADMLAPHARGEQPAVALLLPRGEDLVVAMLAAWRAGFLFCPLEPGYPAGRIRYVLSDLDACAVLTDRPELLADANPGGIPVLDAAEWPAPPSVAAPAPLPEPESTAYVLYTSGTTGEPKGVEYRHRSIAQSTAFHIDEFGVSPDDRVSWIHSVAFDMTQWEVWHTLCAGAELLPYSPKVVAPELVTWLVEHKVTVFLTPTPLAEAIWAAGAELPSLRWMIFGGSAQTVQAPTTDYLVCDSYGPTETYNSTTHLLDPAEATVLNCIGKPNAGAVIYVLDENGRRCSVGMPGEIHIGGTSVAVGYWRRPEMTEERFAERDPDGRARQVYRTGDQGRWLPDGTLEYLGRRDRQLKVRGYRVEPAEIESHLRRDPRVAQAVVHNFPDDSTPLVAYLVADDGQEKDTTAVLAGLRLVLPEFMLPGAVVWLPDLPVNSRGKVDTHALPRPTRADLDARNPWVAPTSETEQRVAEVWSGVLGIDRVGVHDNFFDLGGNSLLLTKLHARLQTALDTVLPISALFEYPTVHALAQSLTSGTDKAGTAGNARDRAGRAQRSRAGARARRPGRGGIDE